MRNRWRRWIPGRVHELPRSVAVYGVPRPGPEQLDGVLGRCDQLRTWARAHGFELDGVPEDLSLIDQALAGDIETARGELGGPARIAAVGSQAGLFLGTVIIATVPGARWRLWPNGHPVVRLPSGRDLDVVAVASDRGQQGHTPAHQRLRRSSRLNPLIRHSGKPHGGMRVRFHSRLT